MAIPSVDLLATLGTHRRDRPLSPLEAARKLDEELGRGVRPEQYPVSSYTIRKFLSLLNLPKPLQKMLGWGGIKRGEIGLEAAYRISTLKERRDQEKLAKETVERELSQKEVSKVVRYKRRLNEKPIEDCIDSVVEMRPKKRHLFISQIKEDLLKRLEENADSEGIETNNLLLKILYNHLPEDSLISLSLKENFVIIFLNEQGEKAIKRQAQELVIPLDDVVNNIISRELVDNEK